MANEPHTDGPSPAPGPGLRNNLERWEHGDYVAEYARTDLSGAEIHILQAHRGELTGRVLELGCGAGRLTGHLIELGGEVHGMDISQPMIEFCRNRYPAGQFVRGDLRDLSPFQAGSFDAVFAICNLLDIFDQEEREHALGQIVGLLRTGGLLVMSSHNRHFAPHVPTPTRIGSRNPKAIARAVLFFPQRMRNHRRLAPLQRFEPDYALINDNAHDFAMLHYYITPQAQAEQLARHGCTLLETVDIDGSVLAPDATAQRTAQIHYVARRGSIPA